MTSYLRNFTWSCINISWWSERSKQSHSQLKTLQRRMNMSQPRGRSRKIFKGVQSQYFVKWRVHSKKWTALKICKGPPPPSVSPCNLRGGGGGGDEMKWATSSKNLHLRNYNTCLRVISSQCWLISGFEIWGGRNLKHILHWYLGGGGLVPLPLN